MRFVTVEEVIFIHDEFIAEGGPGNEPGILEVGSIETAVYRHRYGPFSSHPPTLSQRAAYLMRMAQDHPFIEANKRTALNITEFFLRRHGFELGAGETEIVQFMFKIGGGHLIGKSGSASGDKPVSLGEIDVWIRRHTERI